MNPNHIKPWRMGQELHTHLETIFRRTQMPESGRNYVRHTIASGPARQVQGRRGNTCIRHFSRKMQATMMLESRRGESAMAWKLESDTSVHAYFAQPTTVTMEGRRADGIRASVHQYTADFMVVRDDCISIIEVRDDARFHADSKKNPERYFRDVDGVHHNTAAEEHFAAMGLAYQLVVVSELPHRLIENARFLEDYYREDCPPLSDQECQAVVAAVAADRWVPLRELIRQGISADTIYKAIAERVIYVPLESSRLADTEQVKVYADEVTAQTHALIDAVEAPPLPPIPGTLMLRSGGKISIYGREYKVILQGERDVLLQDPLGKTTSKSVEEVRQLHSRGEATGEGFRLANERMALWMAPPKKVEQAMARLEAVRNPHQTTYSERSLDRFRARIASAQNDLQALEALMDAEEKRGNREPRVSELNEEQIQCAISDHFNTPDRPTAKGAYKKYVRAVQELSEPGGGPVLPVSLQTFTRRCKQRKSIKDREGKRSAYRQAALVPLLSNEHPAHGFRPHEVIYADHTIADIETQSPDGLPLRKPTLSVAIDGCTRQIRAFVLLYEPASARAVMLLIRDYVARWGRLPRVLAVDNGKEFHSHALEYLCRILGIEIRYRPPAEPRGGALIERTFGSINEEVLAELEGNSRCMKSSTREITASVNPQNRVRWNLVALHAVMTKYLFEEHANRVHPELGMSPNDYEEKRMQDTGMRSHVIHQLGENLMLLTSPHPMRRPTRKVVSGRGVNVYGVYYRHPSMASAEGKSVEVRVEWWNASVVYAHINGVWVTAVGTSSRFIADRGNREIELAYRARMREAQARARQDGLARVGTGFGSEKLRPEDFDPVIAAQEREVKRMYQGLAGMGASAVPMPLAAAANDSEATSDTHMDKRVACGEAIKPGASQALKAEVLPIRMPGLPVEGPAWDECDVDDDNFESMGAAMGLR